MTHILVFGDSITQGFLDKKGGWVQRIREVCESNIINYSWDFVFNCGIAGNATNDLLKRFDVEAKARISKTESNMIIFSIGVNDSQYILKKKKTIVSDAEFSRNIERLIKSAKKYTSKIVFMGLLPVEQVNVDPIPWAPDRSYRNDLIRKFDSIIEGVCKENNILFIKTLDKFEKANYTKLLSDGVHPNSKGHELIFKIVYEFLIKNKLI